jgi:hypothetical protein
MTRMLGISFAFALILATLAAARPAAAQFTEFNAFKEPAAPGSSSAGAVSGPDLKPTIDKFEGGKITVGATAYVVATFKNSGSAPVKVTGINLYPSSTVTANVNLNKCAGDPLPPEAVCAITVAVTGLQLGAWRVEVLLDHDGRTRLATAALVGEVEGSLAQKDEQIKADVEAAPPELDFGSTSGGVPLVRSVLLRNRTSDKVTLSSLRLDAPTQSGFVVKSECPEQLKPSESCIINVTWTPIAKGASQAILVVNHSAKSSVTKIDVKGTFSPETAQAAATYPDSASDKGLLVSNMDKVDFGTGIENVAAITVSLVNKGSADLAFKSIGLAGADNGISVARSGCRAGLALKPGDACALTVNWVPSRAGAVIDDLQILHSGARGVLILPIRGSATGAATRGSIPVHSVADMLQSEAPPSKPASASAGKQDDDEAGVGGQALVPPPAIRAARRGRGGGFSSSSDITPVLDGYTVTSHSPTKAIINGPVGSLVVHDGEDVIISGMKWTATIVSTGVILSSEADEILLVFDKALRPIAPQKSATSGATAAPAAPATPGAPAAPTTGGSSSASSPIPSLPVK